MSKYLTSIHEDCQRSLGRSLVRRGEVERLVAEVEAEYWPSVSPPRFQKVATIIEGVMIGVFVAAVIFTAIIFISF